jgi:hypothetical protein
MRSLFFLLHNSSIECEIKSYQNWNWILNFVQLTTKSRSRIIACNYTLTACMVVRPTEWLDMLPNNEHKLEMQSVWLNRNKQFVNKHEKIYILCLYCLHFFCLRDNQGFKTSILVLSELISTWCMLGLAMRTCLWFKFNMNTQCLYHCSCKVKSCLFQENYVLWRAGCLIICQFYLYKMEMKENWWWGWGIVFKPNSGSSRVNLGFRIELDGLTDPAFLLT